MIACLEISNNITAAIATRIVFTFPSIKFGLMIGIGGGVPPAVKLGNIVISISALGGSPGIRKGPADRLEE